MKIDADITTSLLNRSNIYTLNNVSVNLNDILDFANIDTVRLSFFSKESSLIPIDQSMSLLKSLNASVYLCLHCSDEWADPSHQAVPKEWNFKNIKELKSCFIDYIVTIFEAVKQTGINVRKIQVGNEISNGMLWPHLKSPYEYVDFIKTAHILCRQYFPSAKIVLHTDLSYSAEKANQWYALIKARNVDYDLVGVSYYPVWHGTLATLNETVTNLYNLTSKQIILCEVGYMNTEEKTTAWFGDWQCGNIPYTIDGQNAYVKYLKQYISLYLQEYVYPEMYYWGMFSYDSVDHYPIALFDRTAQALPALYEINSIVKD